MNKVDYYLVVGVLFASPAGTEVLDGDGEVGGGTELKQKLFGFVEQQAAQTTLDLHHALYTHKKDSSYSITERRVPELMPVLGSQTAGDVSHKLGGKLPLLSARPAVTPATLKRAATNFSA